MSRSVRKYSLYIALFLSTFAVATWIQQSVIYAFSIMFILLAHELGHYITARHYGVKATFPIFIPMPNLLGTLGAIIAMKSAIPHRKALFDIGISGPLMGLVFAIPATIIGLKMSTIVVIHPKDTMIFLGEPLLFQWLSRTIVGPIPEGMDLVLHPIAFAGWAAFFVTAINLIPAGQLDGGHISYAIFGRSSRWVTLVMVLVLVLLGWKFAPMWYVFAGLILIFFLRHPPPMDTEAPLGRHRIFLGIFAWFLMILCFSPEPIRIQTAVETNALKSQQSLPIDEERGLAKIEEAL